MGSWGWFSFSLLCQDVKVRPLVEYDSKSLEGILPEIPLWVKNPDYDRVCSFNKLARNYIDPSCSLRFSFSSLSPDWLAEQVFGIDVALSWQGTCLFICYEKKEIISSCWHWICYALCFFLSCRLSAELHRISQNQLLLRILQSIR